MSKDSKGGVRTAVIALGVLAGLLAPAFAGSSYELIVTREDGQRMWALPVRPGDSVVLAYTNSIYGAPTEERFTLTRSGFTLRAVRSTSEAVLAYNGLAAPYARDGQFYVASVTAHLASLVLRIGRTGRQRLAVGTRLLPLYEAGEGVQVRVDVTRH